MTNQDIVNVNSDELVLYHFSIKTSKCGGSWNNINDQIAKICVLDVAKILNNKVFNLMSRTNETRHIEWHETWKCKCRFDASVCNNKQCWNNNKCRCECEELIDKGICDKGSIWNPNNCECKCDKSCNIGEYLDYENCKCRKKLVDKLVERSSSEECTENIDEVKTADENECVCSYTICVILAVIDLAISIGIGACFAYSCWYLKNMLLILSLAHILHETALKQRFNKCNSIELINGKSQTNKDQKSNLLFLQQYN